MKQFITGISLLFSLFLFSQEENSPSENPQEFNAKIIAFSPSANSAVDVNGINTGFIDDYGHQKINGLNVRLSPLAFFYPIIPKAIEVPTESDSTVTVNGLHISTGGFTDAKKLNGFRNFCLSSRINYQWFHREFL